MGRGRWGVSLAHGLSGAPPLKEAQMRWFAPPIVNPAR
jgi:hypothetical protein